MLDLAEREALRQGCDEIRLYTNERLEANIALYRRVSYHVTHTEAFQLGTIVHMAKALPPPTHNRGAQS